MQAFGQVSIVTSAMNVGLGWKRLFQTALFELGVGNHVESCFRQALAGKYNASDAWCSFWG